MGKLIVVYWRDIPSQVMARKGRQTVAKVQLSQRFQEAIDRAAMRAGKGGSNAYIEEWRRESLEREGDLREAAEAEAARLDASFDDPLLERMIKAGGVAVD